MKDIITPPLTANPTFTVKDSGERMEFESGMVRDTSEGKVRFDLVYDGPMLMRWAAHLTLGAEKYDARNWMKARGEAELNRFRESAARHFAQWYYGQRDEDHGAAVFFNINGAEYVRELDAFWDAAFKEDTEKVGYCDGPEGGCGCS